MKSPKHSSSYNLIVWMMVIEIILGLATFGAGIYVLVHFVSRYW